MPIGQLLTNIFFDGIVLALLCNLALVVFVWLRIRRSPTIDWFRLFLITTVMIVASTLMPFYFYVPAIYELFGGIVVVLVCANAISILYFVLSFLGKAAWLSSWWARVYIWGGALALVYLSAHYSNLVITHDASKLIFSQWGYIDLGNAKHSEMLLIWSQSLVLFSFGSLVASFFQTVNPARRRQIKLLVITVMVPSLTGVITLGILPTLGIHIPPVTIITNTGAAAIITYTLIRYGSSTIDPGAITASIVQTMNSPAVALDNEHKIVFANRATEAILGSPLAEIIDHPISKLLGREEGSRLERYLHDNQNTHQDNKAFESRIVAQNGKHTSVNIYTSYYREKTGNVQGAILVLADVQRLQNLKASVERQVVERTQELHEEQAKLRASIEGLPIGFIFADDEGKILIQNKALGTIFSLMEPPESLEQLGDKLSNFNVVAAHQKIQQDKQPVIAGEVNLGAKIISIFMGPVVVGEGSAIRTIGTVLLIEDITETTIQTRSKDEFFSIASHELRTPLTAIRGNAGMLLDMYKDVLKREDMQGMVEDIHQSSMRLIDIVNDFLDVSRIEQGKVAFTYEDVELDKVIETTIYEMQAVLQEKHLSLGFNKKTLSQLPKVWADKNRLKQIIYNMVGNAAKFTDKGGITINATAEGDVVKVLVTDTGRGISTDNQRLLFHKFQQAGESLLTRDTTRGTGLGLYISKMLVEDMGGHIALESSTENQGSTFSVTLPVATGKQAAAAKQSAATINTKTGLTHVETVNLAASTLTKPAAGKTGAKPGRLLIVEDDPYVLRMYGRIFSADHVTINTAINGSLGLTAAQSFQPDLILLDVMMPVMNGIETLDVLKADPATKNIPVIMLSSLGEEDIVHQALAKGAAAFLVKSDFAPEQLQQEIQKRLDGVKKTRD